MPGSADPPQQAGFWSDWDSGNLVDVRLVRHGETQGYTADRGLTERGRQQALDKGAELARQLAPGAEVRLPHAPTHRAEETAVGIREGMLRRLRDDRVADVTVGEPVTDERFGNFRLWCDGVAREPTRAYATYRAVLDASDGARPGWFAEADRFFCILAAGGDPITYWLTQPVQYFEPAASAARRFWHGIAEHAGSAPPGVRVVVSTHSGCIRALAAAALGHDPGEPDNTEDARIRLPPHAARAVLSYRGQGVELAVPTTTDPPWHPLQHVEQPARR